MASNFTFSNIQKQLSPTSFTNKEFNEVYPELLELAKQLSYRWDPTVSNESDPGVVLLKELALVLDKINYASDKNALETMPLSVTQQRTARQLFQVLGYYPKWYLSSEVEVNFAWRPSDEENYSEESPTTIYLPAFTQIKDDSGDYVYATIDNVALTSDSKLQSAFAIQGIIKPLTINNTRDITFNLLDKNNRRVYFPDYNIAQNGIYIININAEDSVSKRHYWEQKDNLSVEESGNTYYSFGVDLASNRCYVEFPTDVADLIEDGLHIYYAVSAGRDGLVSIGQLNQLYSSQVTAQIKETDQQSEESTIQLSNDNLFIQNTQLNLYGKDPESIDTMYQNYNHIKGTFDTYVTLRDYNNAVYNTEQVSNAVVTDRTNDVQRSYRIMSQTLSGQENVLYTQERDEYSDEDKISPFCLKVYALQYNDLTDTKNNQVNKSAYDNTFQLFIDRDVEDPLNVDSSLLQLVKLLNDNKCVQHDFLDIESDKICLIKNVAEINLTVFPTVALTQLQKEALKIEIKNAIYDKYNARKLEFGQAINSDQLFSDLLTSSQYIKNISLGQIQYYAYAMYYSQNESYDDINLTPSWRQVCISDEIDYILAGSALQDVDETTNEKLGTFNTMQISGTDTTVLDKFKDSHPYILAQDGNVYYLDGDRNIVLYSTKRKEFRNEVLVKNILCGVTPLYVKQADNFKFQVDEENSEFSVKDIDVETTMLFDFEQTEQTTQATYNLKPNEVIQLVRPQLIDSISYGSYVKYDYDGESVPANSVHRLKTNETLVIYYKTEDSETAPYTRVVYTPTQDNNNILIQPNFQLNQTTNNITLLNIATATPSTTLTCSANQQIAIKEKNQVELNSRSKIYVIGNQYLDEETQQQYYKLTFTLDESGDFYFTELEGDEQFIYSMDDLTYLNILGSGTRIEIRSSLIEGNTFELTNKVISSRNISLLGVQALKDVWQSITGKITVIGQEFINVLGTSAEDSYMTLSPKFQMNIPSNVELTRDGLNYVSGSTSNNVQAISGTLEVTDQQGNINYTNLSTTNFQSNWFQDFIIAQYGASADEAVSEQIILSPAARLQEEISYAMPDGEPTSAYGSITQPWQETIGGNTYTYKYLINGMNLYLMRTLDGQSWDVSQIQYFPVLEGSPVTPIKTGPDDTGNYTYTLQGGIAPGKSIIAYDATQNLANQVAYTYSNGEDSVQTQFVSTLDLSGKTFQICTLYTISSQAYFGYDTSRQNYQQLYALDDLSTSISNTNPDDGIIVFQVQNGALAIPQTYYTPLYRMSSAYEYKSEDFAPLYNLWQFTSKSGQTKYLKTGESKSDMVGIQSVLIANNVQLPSSWSWPADCQLTIAVFNDLLNNLSPQLFNITYKNSGEEEQTVQFGEDSDLNWSIRGLARLSFVQDQACQLYDNQKLTITAKTLNSDEDFSSYVFNASDIIVPNPESGVKNIYLYLSKEFIIEGFAPVDVHYLDMNNSVNYPLLLVTQDSYSTTSTPSSNYSKDSGASKIIQITADNLSQSFNFAINTPGTYMFEVKNYQTLYRFTLTPLSGSFKLLQNPSDGQDDSYDLKARGAYQFVVTVDGEESNIGFDLYVEKADSEATETNSIKIELTPLQQIDMSKGLYGFVADTSDFYIGINANEILTKVQTLSDLNGVDTFNYFYTAPDSKIIENPLLAYQFNNHNHFYNPFTICKIVEYNILGQDNIFING